MSAARLRPRGVMFDLDGTLVDSFADIATAVNRTLAHYGQPALPLAAVRAAVGNGSEALVRAVLPQLAERTAEAVDYYLDRYAEVALEQTQLMPGALAALEHFRDRPLAVVTNKPQHLTRAILQGLGIWERFRIVLGGDALPRHKPDPLPLRRVLACFALPAGEALMVGDGVQDIAAGRAAGVPTAAVASGATPREVLEAAGPTELMDTLAELVARCD